LLAQASTIARPQARIIQLNAKHSAPWLTSY
jgi:hypothetical protein